jgi:hypothetical protein
LCHRVSQHAVEPDPPPARWPDRPTTRGPMNSAIPAGRRAVSSRSGATIGVNPCSWA